MRVVAPVVALLRRLRAERSVVILLFVLVAITSLAVAAGPRLFNRVSDDGLRYAAAHSTAAQRNLQFVSVDRFEPGPGGPVRRRRGPCLVASRRLAGFRSRTDR